MSENVLGEDLGGLGISFGDGSSDEELPIENA